MNIKINRNRNFKCLFTDVEVGDSGCEVHVGSMIQSAPKFDSIQFDMQTHKLHWLVVGRQPASYVSKNAILSFPPKRLKLSTNTFCLASYRMFDVDLMFHPFLHHFESRDLRIHSSHTHTFSSPSYRINKIQSIQISRLLSSSSTYFCIFCFSSFRRVFLFLFLAMDFQCGIDSFSCSLVNWLFSVHVTQAKSRSRYTSQLLRKSQRKKGKQIRQPDYEFGERNDTGSWRCWQ